MVHQWSPRLAGWTSAVIPSALPARVDPEGADADDEEDEEHRGRGRWQSVPVGAEAGRQEAGRGSRSRREQVEGEGDGYEGEGDVEELVDEVEAGPGRDRDVLSLAWASLIGPRVAMSARRDDRVDGRLPQGQRRDEAELEPLARSLLRFRARSSWTQL
jgi:hypothetical protein